MKLLTVVGARPQFIKAATVSRILAKHPVIKETILHTGQHYDDQMSAVFFREMEIPEPELNLEIRSSLHGEMTGQMLAGIEHYILKDKHDAVLVYGDTNSTLAGALAAVKLHIPIVHVEAGLRSFNMTMPEEVNRILTDRISTLLCCPSENAVKNLQKEGFNHLPATVLNTGDVMLDAALYYSKRSVANSTIIKEIGNEPFILCTFHRAENTNDPVRLKSIVEAINIINKKIKVVLPMHPRTKKTIEALGLQPECKIVNPVGYFDMLELLKNCSLVMTDSGGLQKEAFFFKKFCLTLRDETEWVELVENGFNVLAGADCDKITKLALDLSTKSADFSKPLYGNGDAAGAIVNALEQYL